MTATRKMTGGIIAAGEGSRLRRDGYVVPKPLVPVAGVPLIDAVIRNFDAAGVGPLVIIVNEDERDCVDRVRERFPGLAVTFIVKTTASSFESFFEVLGAAGDGDVLVSTVDAWCRPRDFARFAAAAAARPAGAVVLAVTPLVADEKPLWVDVDGAGRVTRLGEPQGQLVTAGLYLVPDRVRRMPRPAGPRRLREFLAWLHAQEQPLYAEVIEDVVDVDRAQDVALAEALAITHPTGGAE